MAGPRAAAKLGRMPEGDTVWRTAHRLHQVFAGQALTECDLRWPGLSTLDFAGHTTIEVVPRGKHLLQRLSGGWTIHSHLRMEGSWRIEKTDAAAPPRGDAVRAVLATQAYRAVGRSLGELDVVRTADEARLVGHLGPDLLGPDWDLERAVANLLDTDAPLAAALLDQTRVAGLGTMWTAEALFLEGLDPFAPAAERDATVLAALLGRARRLLRASCSSAVPTSTGSTRPGHETYVHGRRHKPCRRCGTLVRMQFVGPPTQRRTLYFCPCCQAAPY